MSIASALSGVNWDKAYLGVIGGSVLLSVGHYLLQYRTLHGDIPIHFDYLGRPDNYVNKVYFILYPVIIGVCAATGYGIRTEASAPVRASDQISARVALAGSNVVLLICQWYAAKISRKEKQRLSPEVILGAFAVLGTCGLYSLLNGLLNT